MPGIHKALGSVTEIKEVEGSLKISLFSLTHDLLPPPQTEAEVHEGKQLIPQIGNGPFQREKVVINLF